MRIDKDALQVLLAKHAFDFDKASAEIDMKPQHVEKLKLRYGIESPTEIAAREAALATKVKVEVPDRKSLCSKVSDGKAVGKGKTKAVTSLPTRVAAALEARRNRS